MKTISKSTDTKVQIFSNPQFGNIRIVMNESENPLFCLADVCKVLGLEQVSRVKSRLSEDGVTNSKVTDSLGRLQDATFVDERNFYKCIFQSRKPEAEDFSDWVTGEVLPAIRKTGGYIASRQDDTPELIMARALQVEKKNIFSKLLAELEIMRTFAVRNPFISCALGIFIPIEQVLKTLLVSTSVFYLAPKQIKGFRNLEVPHHFFIIK